MRFIELSHTLSPGTPTLPDARPLALELVRTLAADGYNAYKLTSALHTGTHIDMPMHLVDDGRTAADFPPDCFAGRGVLLDVRGQDEIAMDARYEAMVTPGDIALLYTGFDERYGYEEYFTKEPFCQGAFSIKV